MKVHVDITVRLVLDLNKEKISAYNVIDEMDYNFVDTTGSAKIVETEITDTKVVKEEV